MLAQCLNFPLTDHRSLATDFDPLQTIENRLVETSKLFEMGRATFERDLARPYPQRSFSDGSAFGNLHPYDTQARFRPLRRLGRGSFGEVDEVEEVSTKEVYARKHIQFPSNKAGAAAREDEVRNEVQVMRKLTHQHIATVLFWLKEQDSCNIFMKPAGDYDLWCYLENCIQEGYPTKRIQDILPWFGCLLDALAFAHRLNVTHRDIKPSNILIKDSQVYLADFGSAKDFTLQGTSKTSNYNVCGSAVYLAPETRSEHPRGRQADVFSLGCVLSEMLTVCSNRSLEAYQAWRLAPDDERGIYAFRSNLPKVDKWLQSLSDDNSDGWRDVLVWQIKCMLYKEPERRNSADKGLNFLISHQQQRLICPNH